MGKVLSARAVLAGWGSVSTAVLGNTGLDCHQSTGDNPQSTGTRGSQASVAPILWQSVRTIPGVLWSFELAAPYRSACLSPQPGKPSSFLASVNVSGGLCAELDLTHLTAFPPGKFTPTSPCSAPGQCLGAKLLCTRAALSRCRVAPLQSGAS